MSSGDSKKDDRVVISTDPDIGAVRAPLEPVPPRLPPERPGPEGGKRAENRRRRIKVLCDAALSLFLKRGIESVTIDEIVKAASVAKGSFYRYFRDKEELVATLIAPIRAQIQMPIETARAALEAAETYEAIMGAYRALGEGLAGPIIAHTDLVQLYLQESRAPGVGARAPIRALAREIGEQALVLSQLAHARGIVKAVDPRVSALVVVGAVERLMFGLLSGEDVGDPLAIPDTLVSLVMDGLRVEG